MEWPLTIRIPVAGEDKQFHEVGDLVRLSEEQHGPLVPTRANPDIWVKDGFSNAEIHHHYELRKDRYGPKFTINCKTVSQRHRDCVRKSHTYR